VLFLCFLIFFSFWKKNTQNPSNSKIRTKYAKILKSANSLLERSNSKSILNLRKEKSAKYVIFGKNPGKLIKKSKKFVQNRFS
jgi:hypothetical protein